MQPSPGSPTAIAASEAWLSNTSHSTIRTLHSFYPLIPLYPLISLCFAGGCSWAHC